MLVSVIIPSYNHERYLRRAVDSALGQTFKRIEVICVDDGSTDDSLAYLRSVEDPRIRVFEQENRGAHAAINRGLELAKGDYLAILNSDDVFHPERIQKLLCHMDSNGAAMACSWLEIVDADGASRGIKKGWRNMHPSWYRGEAQQAALCQSDFNTNILLTNFPSTTSNFFFKRSVYRAIGGMRPLRFAHDWDFALRTAADFQCSMVNEPLLQYRLHGSNTINSDHAGMIFETCWALAANLHRYEADLHRPLSSSKREAKKTISTNGTSLPPKNCDQLFGELRQYIEAHREKGYDAPEEHILKSEELRAAFMKFVHEP